MTALPDCFPSELEPFRVKAPDGLRSRQRPRDSAGRCYELAGRYFLDHGATPGVVLVHGLVRWQGETMMAHAWVKLPGGIVYDRGLFFDADGYAEVLLPLVVKEWGDLPAWSKETRELAWDACDELKAAVREMGEGGIL